MDKPLHYLIDGEEFITYERASQLTNMDRRRLGEAMKYGKIRYTCKIPEGCKSDRLLMLKDVIALYDMNANGRTFKRRCAMSEISPAPCNAANHEVRTAPTPWKSKYGKIYDANGILIAYFLQVADLYDLGDARLAAKAPELIAMVKDMADELRKHEKWCARDHELCRKCGKEETCLIIKADELIAEAEGENQ